MKTMRKAVVAGACAGALALAGAFANAVPDVTSDEMWVGVSLVFGAFVTGVVTYYVKNDGLPGGSEPGVGGRRSQAWAAGEKTKMSTTTTTSNPAQSRVSWSEGPMIIPKDT